MKLLLLAVIAITFSLSKTQNPYHSSDPYPSLSQLSIPYYYDYDWYYASFKYENQYEYDYLRTGQLHPFIKKLPCQEKLGVEFKGADLLVDGDGSPIFFKTHSFRDCAIVCGMHPECVLYTYVNNGGDKPGCYLKKGVGYTAVANVNAVSGDGCLEAKYSKGYQAQ